MTMGCKKFCHKKFICRELTETGISGAGLREFWFVKSW